MCVRMCVQTNGGTHQDNAHTTLLALIQKGISIKSIIEWALERSRGGPHSDNGCGIMPGTFQVGQEGNYKEPYYYKKGRF